MSRPYSPRTRCWPGPRLATFSIEEPAPPGGNDAGLPRVNYPGCSGGLLPFSTCRHTSGSAETKKARRSEPAGFSSENFRSRPRGSRDIDNHRSGRLGCHNRQSVALRNDRFCVLLLHGCSSLFPRYENALCLLRLSSGRHKSAIWNRETPADGCHYFPTSDALALSSKMLLANVGE
jgi:hypothetical protein